MSAQQEPRKGDTLGTWQFFGVGMMLAALVFLIMGNGLLTMLCAGIAVVVLIGTNGAESEQRRKGRRK